MKARLLILGLCSVMWGKVLDAQAPVWADVAPIFYRECASCHRPGQIGESYLNAMGYTVLTQSPSFYSIPAALQSRTMPPWPADPHYVRYLNERILPEQEIDLITTWINNGHPAGDTSQAPPPPEFPAGSVLGTPDLTLTMKVPFYIPGDNQDRYQVFVLPSYTSEDKQLRAVEFVPGNPSIVHHVFMYLCTDGSADSLDKLTPEYGYPSFGGAGEGANVTFIGLYGPGMTPRFFPEGTGLKFKAGTHVVIQVHYAPTLTPAYDQSSVNLFFADYDDFRPVKNKRVGENYIVEPVFFIPKDMVVTFHSEYPIDSTFSLFAIAPHMHLFGKSFRIWAQTPSGDSIPLSYVPNWKFNWQFLYQFNHFVILPKGTVIKAEATYDNTVNNPFYNGHNVSYGESSFDEMFKYFMQLVFYRPGDEFVVFDTTWEPVPIGVDEIETAVSTPQLYDPYPNPARDKTALSFFLPRTSDVRLYVYDLSGRLAQPLQRMHMQPGLHRHVLDITGWPPGLYFISLDTGDRRLTKRLVVP
ncbi:MAG: T9SS type A sorting domain-containing protein [Chitinophagales bacterium]|nr:T9SS type A sorting domain-containing protein [Chitinophagales bacterium]MDW8427375.1 T9SS type A sorting domain-containing protein [Chitinophagales bacterium]